MIQITPQMRILLAVEPVDLRRGIDGLAALCRQALASDPQTGALFVFHSRRGHAIKCLTYDGYGTIGIMGRQSQVPAWTRGKAVPCAGRCSHNYSASRRASTCDDAFFVACQPDLGASRWSRACFFITSSASR